MEKSQENETPANLLDQKLPKLKNCLEKPNNNLKWQKRNKIVEKIIISSDK